MRRAAVFFHDQPDWWVGKVLRRGYSHCDVAVELPDGGWLAVSGTLQRPGRVWLLPLGARFDPERAAVGLRARFLLRECPPGPIQIGPWALTCVAVVKAVLRVYDRRVVTPWQLWCRLGGEEESEDGRDQRAVCAADATGGQVGN